MLVFLVLQRLIELVIARRHAVQAFAEGGYEVGQAHYPWMVCTHMLFFLGLILEAGVFRPGISAWFPYWLGLLILAQIGRYWMIASLGRYWNTRIIIVPGMKLVQKGPYRYLRHPNYVIVVIELIAIPFMFNAYITASVITLMNAAVLFVRIRTENQALIAQIKSTDYTD